MNDEVRQSELYQHIWMQDSSYGTSARDVEDTVLHRIAPHMKRVLQFTSTAHVVDFGAGDGRFLRCMWRNCFLALGTGVDVYVPETLPNWLNWMRSAMWEASPRGDYVISTDALEHIPPGMVNFSLARIADTAPHGFLRISLIEDRYGTDRGLHLHESVFTSAEWLARLDLAGIKPSSYRVYLDNGYEQALEVWF